MSPDPRPWAIWFFGLLGAVLVAQVVGWSFNEVERVGSPPVAELDPARVLDRGYYEELDAAAADGLAVRGPALWARKLVDYDLLGDSPSPRVVAGADGWLYFTDYLVEDCAVLTDLADAVGTFAAEHGGARMIVTAPKSALHPGPLPDHWGEASCAPAARGRVAERGGAAAIDVEALLAAAIAEGDDAFLRADTHWSASGRLAVAEAIVESLAPGAWDPGGVDDATLPRPAALERFLGRHRSSTMLGHVTRLEVEVLEERTIDALVDPVLTVYHSHGGSRAVVPGVTYVVGDSQLGYVVPLFAPYFAELRFVSWLALEFGAPAFPDATERGLVIVQSIESQAASRLRSDVVGEVVDRLSG